MPGSADSDNLVRLDSAQEAMRRHFLGWQCRIRQRQMRHADGQPSDGMCPVCAIDGEGSLGNLVVLIGRTDSAEDIAKFRHMVRRTQDPRERREAAVREMSAAYFQHPDDFSDVMTALFGPHVAYADRLLDAGHCRLHFDQYAQTYDIPCSVRALTTDEPAWQATYWHNSLFNPNIPAGIRILAFTPDWAGAEARPAAN